ncbi:5'/3'-nucleotidase SurE [Cryobacterium sp. TmT2-59]|uniref:5'/3'-nucleotidase SurE n=1 Tax=Cryobacterium sp. TmT2-59 TaxID=1259264 RepID=UPI00106D8129|nr:5'/3'-nucleotidase SurE [Cryobacterium sp. TmT2-59]TFC85966.1 5'/3'-nucleotidase SurE [Cryobacterium sp. TmT2-59]
MIPAFTTLITNDDGINSPGLLRLALAALDAGLDVVVAAPAAESSGSGASITSTGTDGRIVVDRRHLEGLDGVPCYAVHAAPALISLIASHGAFGQAPELVLSGVNPGANVGRAILHSGTVGAALTAGVNGGRGLAVSLDVAPDTTTPRWGVASRLAARLIPFLLDQPTGTVLNLNVPIIVGDEPPEVRTAKLARFGIVQTTMTQQDRHQIRLAVADNAAHAESGSDADLLRLGYATVTSLRSVEERPLADLVLEPVPVATSAAPPGPGRQSASSSRTSGATSVP